MKLELEGFKFISENTPLATHLTHYYVIRPFVQHSIFCQFACNPLGRWFSRRKQKLRGIFHFEFESPLETLFSVFLNIHWGIQQFIEKQENLFVIKALSCDPFEGTHSAIVIRNVSTIAFSFFCLNWVSSAYKSLGWWSMNTFSLIDTFSLDWGFQGQKCHQDGENRDVGERSLSLMMIMGQGHTRTFDGTVSFSRIYNITFPSHNPKVRMYNFIWFIRTFARDSGLGKYSRCGLELRKRKTK